MHLTGDLAGSEQGMLLHSCEHLQSFRTGNWQLAIDVGVFLVLAVVNREQKETNHLEGPNVSFWLLWQLTRQARGTLWKGRRLQYL